MEVLAAAWLSEVVGVLLEALSNTSFGMTALNLSENVPSFLPKISSCDRPDKEMLRIFFIVWQVFDGCQFCLMGFFSLFIPPWKCWSAFEWNFHLHFLVLLIFWQFPSFFSISLSIDFLYSCHSLMDSAQLFEAASCDLRVHPHCVVGLLVGPK